MTERIVNSTWWLALMTMICGTGAGALFLGYRGLFELLAGRWESGFFCVLISIGAGAANWVLCRHRNDLL